MLFEGPTLRPFITLPIHTNPSQNKVRPIWFMIDTGLSDSFIESETHDALFAWHSLDRIWNLYWTETSQSLPYGHSLSKDKFTWKRFSMVTSQFHSPPNPTSYLFKSKLQRFFWVALFPLGTSLLSPSTGLCYWHIKGLWKFIITRQK